MIQETLYKRHDTRDKRNETGNRYGTFTVQKFMSDNFFLKYGSVVQFLNGAFFAFNVAVALKLSGAVTAFRWSFFNTHFYTCRGFGGNGYYRSSYCSPPFRSKHEVLPLPGPNVKWDSLKENLWSTNGTVYPKNIFVAKKDLF